MEVGHVNHGLLVVEHVVLVGVSWSLAVAKGPTMVSDVGGLCLVVSSGGGLLVVV